MTWSVRRARRDCWTDRPDGGASGLNVKGLARAVDFAYQRPPENETTMSTYCFNASLPMSLDRQPVEGNGACAEGA